MSRGLALLLVFTGCAQGRAPEKAVPKPPVEVTTSVDRAVATAGDRITFEIVVEHDPEVELQLPDLARELGGMRMVDLGEDPPAGRDGRTRRRRFYVLVADVVGSYVLPAVEVRAKLPAAPEPETFTTSQIFVEIKSVLPQDGEADDIRDIKPLVRPARSWRWPVVAGTALALAAAGLVLWRRRRRLGVVVPPAPAHEIAFAALEALRHTDFSDPEAARRWHFGVSEVVRVYVEARFGINATDLTSEEIMARLDDTQEMGPALRLELRAILYDTDHVKFAAYRAGDPEIRATHERALRFVEQTMPRPQAREAA